VPMKPTGGRIPARRRPPWIMQHVFDPLTLFVVGRLGLDDHNGTRVLEVKGRTSGEWRANPVKLIEVDGRRYLVAMYGETQWVKNLRAQGCGRLRLGAASTDFRAVELDREDKLPVSGCLVFPLDAVRRSAIVIP
jgi:deazaflavin-dependent oxidoreductase (nitroreductase family)